MVTDLLLLILALHTRHVGHTTDADAARLDAVAREMTEISTAHPLWTGPAAGEATALALYAVAAHESGFEASVQDCSACPVGGARCDRGRSVTLYQLRQGAPQWGAHTREQLCSSNRLATGRALHILRRYARCAPDRMFVGYATGSCDRDSRAGQDIAARWRTALRSRGITVTWQGEARYE